MFFECIYNLSNLCNLKEIANYRKWDTDLPVNIWIDDSKRSLNGKHFKRLKFQINYANKVQKNNFASVSLIDNKVVNVDNVLKKRNCKVNTDTFTSLENFCRNNNFALCVISDSIISESDFFSVIIKGKDLKSDEDIKAAKIKTQNIIRKGIADNHYDDDAELLELAKKALDM